MIKSISLSYQPDWFCEIGKNIIHFHKKIGLFVKIKYMNFYFTKQRSFHRFSVNIKSFFVNGAESEMYFTKGITGCHMLGPTWTRHGAKFVVIIIVAFSLRVISGFGVEKANVRVYNDNVKCDDRKQVILQVVSRELPDGARQ